MSQEIQPVSLTDKAIAEAKLLINSQDTQALAFRVYVAGGSCSGLQYGIGLDEFTDDKEDFVYEVKGLKVAVDKLSANYLTGATVDYFEDEDGLNSGFKVDNPNVSSGCGSCGGGCSCQ